MYEDICEISVDICMKVYVDISGDLCMKIYVNEDRLSENNLGMYV